MLDEAWKQKKRMSPQDRAPTSSTRPMTRRGAAGALGGKVTGAGGGGYMLFYCALPTKHRVAEALIELGVHGHEFAFEPDGLRTWRVDG